MAKIRKDYVSNSSSSSFIVIKNTGAYVGAMHPEFIARCTVSAYSKFEPLLLPNNHAETEFGWQTEIYSDIWSKLNWAAIILCELYQEEQAIADKDQSYVSALSKNSHWGKCQEYTEMLKSLMLKEVGLYIDIRFKDYEEDYFGVGYIDHQSGVWESPENACMFESEEKLRDFIFNTDSYIDNSNDNGGRDD